MKSHIKIVFYILILLLLSCSKENLDTDINAGSKKVMVSEYDPDFFPEGGVYELLVSFFNEIIDFQNDSNAVCTDFGLSEGGWYLTASLNYICADAMAQIDEIEEHTFFGSIQLTGDTILELEGNSLINCLLTIRTAIDEFNTDTYQVGAVQCNFEGVEEDRANFSFKVFYGNKTTYEEVNLLNPPTGVPNNAYLKMGVPSVGYHSAATETRWRYNPYLYRSKMESEVFAHKKYVTTNISYNYSILWTDGTNCYANWPDNNYVLFVECPDPNEYLTRTVYGSTFNHYLNRFFQLKLTPIINQNLLYSQKTLFLSIGVNHLPDSFGCGHFNPYAKSVFAYTLTKATVTLMPDPLPTI
jgi:hypothetical protein